jgi:hypothetical protein
MNTRFDGGVMQDPDGSWRVACCFSGLTAGEAQHVSHWLEQLMNKHLHEITDNNDPRLRPTVDDVGHA